MSIQKLWKVKCTDAEHSSDPFRYRWYPESYGTPTICVDNDNHDIETTGANKPKVEKTKDEKLVTIDEGNMTRTGRYNLTNVSGEIDSGAGVITTISNSWDYDIGAIKVAFDVTDDMIGDKIALYINKEANIGLISSNVSIPTTWTSQDYTQYDTVTYGDYTYTCIEDTVSSTAPRSSITGMVNSDYWRKGLRIVLTAQQLAYINDSFLAYLFDGVNKSFLGEIWHVDSNDNSIYVGNKHTNDTPLTQTYTAGAAYFLTGYQMIGDVKTGFFELGAATRREYGNEKIGAAYISEESVVTLEYENVDGAAGKKFFGEVTILRGSGTHRG